MYYPQDTVLEMGPTAVLPGSQYWTVDHEEGTAKERHIGEDRLSYEAAGHIRKKTGDHSETDRLNEEATRELDSNLKEMFVTVPAGSFAILHYDLFHRGTRLRAIEQPTRYMFKFQYFRTADPRSNSFPLLPAPLLSPIDSHAIHDEMHRFLGGTSLSPLPCKSVPVLVAELRGPKEPARICASYSLGRMVRENGSEEALRELVDALQTGPESCRRAGAFGLIAAGQHAVAPLVEALEAADADSPMRRYALFGFGELGEPSPGVMAALRVAVSRPPPFSYEQTLEIGTACVALGLLGQGQLARSQPPVLDEICGLLGRAAGQIGEDAKPCHPNRSATAEQGSGKYMIREDAAYGLALVCAAAPAAVLDRHRGLVDHLVSLVQDEDRYVMGYAAAALRCLAEAGSDEALRSLYRALLDSATPDDEGTRINAARGLEVLDSRGSGAGKGELMPLVMLVDRQVCPRTTPSSPF